jgi:hypothetical protein
VVKFVLNFAIRRQIDTQIDRLLPSFDESFLSARGGLPPAALLPPSLLLLLLLRTCRRRVPCTSSKHGTNRFRISPPQEKKNCSLAFVLSCVLAMEIQKPDLVVEAGGCCCCSPSSLAASRDSRERDAGDDADSVTQVWLCLGLLRASTKTKPQTPYIGSVLVPSLPPCSFFLLQIREDLS